MHHVSTTKPRAPDPDGTFLRSVGRRLDALSALNDPDADQVAELRRLRVIWAHAQPTPAVRPPRRLGAPARLPDE